MMTESSRESQLVLLIDDDVMITEGLSAGLEREGRTVITCNDLESAQLIVERLNPSHVVTDVRLSGPFGYEGLDFIRYAKRHAPGARVILMTGDAPETLQLEAAERGAVAFLRKPFDIRELDAILDLMECAASTSGATDAAVIRMPMLDEIVRDGALRPFFQPIVRLAPGYPHIGYEALARYRNNSLLRNPEVLFQYAARKDRVADLELACCAATLQSGAELARGAVLFLNIHPDVLSRGDALHDVLARECQRSGVPAERLVLEITEQATLPSSRSLMETIQQLRELGVRFAFDDVGVAYSHLPMLDQVRPSFLKVSQDFGTAFESDPTKMKIVRNLLSLARDFECDLIVEGIEHAATADAAELMGIKYGQGFYFHRPAEAETFHR
jgi:EAL domain-containing protein (putative c-di-GMP-specific phosphodiesterase class I)/ActR/RegA family two-component response regulator